MGFLSVFKTDKQANTTSTTNTTTIGAATASVDLSGDGAQNWATNASGVGTTALGAGAIQQTSSVSGTGNNVQYIDAGAVSRSLDAAFRGVEQANTTTRAAIDRAASLVDGVFQAQASMSETLAKSVQDTKAPDVRVLAFGALAIVGAVAAFGFGRK